MAGCQKVASCLTTADLEAADIFKKFSAKLSKGKSAMKAADIFEKFSAKLQQGKSAMKLSFGSMRAALHKK